MLTYHFIPHTFRKPDFLPTQLGDQALPRPPGCLVVHPRLGRVTQQELKHCCALGPTPEAVTLPVEECRDSAGNLVGWRSLSPHHRDQTPSLQLEVV